jgi:hypothetical protein
MARAAHFGPYQRTVSYGRSFAQSPEAKQSQMVQLLDRTGFRGVIPLDDKNYKVSAAGIVRAWRSLMLSQRRFP